jgi:hypothetical protein
LLENKSPEVRDLGDHLSALFPERSVELIGLSDC